MKSKIKELKIFVVFLCLFGAAIANDRPLSSREATNLALRTVNEIQRKCIGKCSGFFLLTFKNELINSFNWTKDFTTKLIQDAKWARDNNCTSDASVEGIVNIFSGEEYSYSFHKNPKCLFKRFESLDPNYPTASATDIIQAVDTIPETHYLHPNFNSKNRNRYFIERKNNFIPGRPIRNTLQMVDNLLDRTWSIADRILGCPSCNSGGIDVGGGKYGQSYYFSKSGIDVGGGKYGPAYKYSGGIDVGGGKIGPGPTGSNVQESAFELIENRKILNIEISKASVFRDIVVQKEQGYEFLFEEHKDYWTHYGISKDELRFVINGPSSSELLNKVDELEKRRQEIEKKLVNISKDGNTFFNQYEKDKVNREFIYLLGSKILE
jgi:hypothetical protein